MNILTRRHVFVLLTSFGSVHWSCGAIAAEPRVLVDGCRLELVAEEPSIVTPVAMAFDDRGRLLVIESHTHQRPDDYEGPAGDRVRMFSDSDGDGKLDRWTTFAEGFQQAMGLLAAGPGRLYLVTRRSVVLLVDDDGDGHVDRQTPLLKLESEDQYPHNALSGIAHDPSGRLYLGMGENHGLKYTITEADGRQFVDSGGAGIIFTCDADGANLRRFATGFWNPFSLCMLPGGQLFVVDNDPDASPPCRLIHAVETGDYGHRYEYGRAGVHPLQAWNGELPGTLPMAAGTGEAPCAVVPHRGYLWVTSWGDHRLERYRLVSQGASFTAEREVVVQGDTDFRPTGCAVGPDGALYFADWVDQSYPVHGKGRIWRLDTNGSDRVDVPTGNASKRLRHDPFAVQAEVLRIARGEQLPRNLLVHNQAIRWKGHGREAPVDRLRHSLADENADVRLFAVRWISDERLTALRDDVAKLLEGEIPSDRYYLAVLAAMDWLDNPPKMRKTTFNDALLARELGNAERSPRLHALALRMISPDHDWLTLDRLRDLVQSKHRDLRREAVRTLATRSDPDRFELLADVAKDEQFDADLRADAVAGLAGSPRHTPRLKKLAADDDRAVAREASRVLRLTGARPALAEEKPPAADLEAWTRLLAADGDAESGRRLFFSGLGARCNVCHQHRGRGGRIGPDLTRLAVSNSRAQIIESILHPSREMAPNYQPWTLQIVDGRTIVALRIHKSGDGGQEVYADTNGALFELTGDQIEVRQASATSIMPAGLEQTFSIEDLRDLVTFLASPAEN